MDEVAILTMLSMHLFAFLTAVIAVIANKDRLLLAKLGLILLALTIPVLGVAIVFYRLKYYIKYRGGFIDTGVFSGYHSASNDTNSSAKDGSSDSDSVGNGD